MRRFLGFCIILATILLPELAYATCPANPLDCKDPNMRTSIPANNVKADGVTSDDAALKAVLDLCATVGGTVHLPPGRILLNGTGAAPIVLQNCHIVGSGIIAGTNGVVASNGSMILLTSTTVKPFIAGNNWRMDGVSFYWPNQTTGTTAYPSLLNCDVSCTSWIFEGNSVINAYDFLVDAPGAAQGGYKVLNNWLYAVHDLFRSAGQGDSILVSNNQMTPGNWFRIAPGTSVAAANAGSLVNIIFHITNSTSHFWNLIAKDNAVFAWRYGFKLEATAGIGISDIQMTWDGVGSVIDSSLGGNWTPAVKFAGLGGSNAIDLVTALPRGNAPAFNMGATGALILNDYVLGTNGSAIKTAGANVYLDNVTITTVGAANDGGNYYAIDYTANPGGLVVSVKDSSLQGRISSALVHGIGSSTSVEATRMIVQNNQFLYFQDPINIASALTTSIQGNWSGGTNGTVAIQISGVKPVLVKDNNWDKSPTAIVTGCGTGCNVVGNFSGFIGVGTPSIQDVDLALPWVPLGANGACTFNASIPTPVGATVSGTPPVWHLHTLVSMSTGQIFYDCSGRD